ncbi:phenylacetic acid degradation protein PaaY [Marivibrio halodurans]|uniref:Phenylacetic acid degradation protein PaaY n=1 Tax=Marivibrio halodurans TaxID=2039722 RepID=A0A8J7V3X9_9PROT|nr:phenylacetic acid degradation protein PaaY [Marivibrio halodurans]MBP5857089.1 phenylacetic acid degradation protein PaaY [Marivibrio halodurans]
MSPTRPKVYAIDGVVPVVHPSAFVHPTAVLIGDAVVGPGCYVGPGACMRGDFGRVAMKRGSNLQDNCVMHAFPGMDCVIEEDGHIGHGAVLHGCIVGRDALVGMNSVVMDGAVLGESSMVAAMAFVKAGFELPARTLCAGTPAKIMRELSAEEIAWKRDGTADYQRLVARCHATLALVDPLTEEEAERPALDAGESVPLFQTKGR